MPLAPSRSPSPLREIGIEHIEGNSWCRTAILEKWAWSNQHLLPSEGRVMAKTLRLRPSHVLGSTGPLHARLPQACAGTLACSQVRLGILLPPPKGFGGVRERKVVAPSLFPLVLVKASFPRASAQRASSPFPLQPQSRGEAGAQILGHSSCLNSHGPPFKREQHRPWSLGQKVAAASCRL